MGRGEAALGAGMGAGGGLFIGGRSVWRRGQGISRIPRSPAMADAAVLGNEIPFVRKEMIWHYRAGFGPKQKISFLFKKIP